LLADYSLFPLTGFQASYSVSGLPKWASFDAKTASIRVNTPSQFTNQSFEISYSDARKNSHKISASFVPINSYINNNFNFLVTNNHTISNNFFTIAFPIFALNGNTLSTIRSSDYASLTNIAQYPWTNTITLYGARSSGSGNNFPYLIVNGTGTYVFGVLISSSGYFTNSTGTYLNGVYQGNSGFTTTSTGTFLNGNYMGPPGFRVDGNQVYFGGAILPSTFVSQPGYLTTNAQGTYVNGILISNSGYFTNATGTYNNGVFVGSSGFTTTTSGTFLNGNYMGPPGYVIIGNQAFYAGSLIPDLPNWGSTYKKSGKPIFVNDQGTYFNGIPINNQGYFTNSSGTFYNGVFQSNNGYTTTSNGTYYNGAYVGAPGYSVVGDLVYYGGVLVSGHALNSGTSGVWTGANTATYPSSSSSSTTFTTGTNQPGFVYGTGTGGSGVFATGSSGSSNTQTFVSPITTTTTTTSVNSGSSSSGSVNPIFVTGGNIAEITGASGISGNIFNSGLASSTSSGSSSGIVGGSFQNNLGGLVFTNSTSTSTTTTPTWNIGGNSLNPLVFDSTNQQFIATAAKAA
jgi:hypothetical protein